jgi:hypothetical protein
MKNSPHRHKHQLKKALRKASHINVNSQKDKTKEREGKFTEYNNRRGDNKHLSPLNMQTVKEIFNLYKHNLERARLIDKAHAKRSSPGIVDKNTPQTHQNQQNPKVYTLRTHQGSLKTDKIGRKILKSQNAPHREAA